MKAVALTCLLLLVIAPPVVLLLLSSTPTIDLDKALTAIGSATPVNIRVTAPHGTRHILAAIEQNGKQYQIFEATEPSSRFLFWTHRQPVKPYAFPAGTKIAAALKDGPARLVIEATSNDLRGAGTQVTRDVVVVTQPPRLSADGAQHYIHQGGAELVTFSIAGVASNSGVRAGKYTFRSFPLTGKPARFSLFAFPWDLPVNTDPAVFAESPTGDQVTARFWHKIFPEKFRKRNLDLDDAMIERLVNQIEPGGSGDLVARFLKINGEMRRQNNQTLSDLRLKTEERFLWAGAFLELANSTVESKFADVRSYMYKGKKIDEQVHLGFDLARVKNTPIPAANTGKIVFADKLGIYGNCVVIDHGYGLQSIYGHLNSIQVKPGETVQKGQIIGLSGATGLAGGDHLHFSMQVDGIQVNPLEWWDEHWIEDRILSKVQ